MWLRIVRGNEGVREVEETMDMGSVEKERTQDVAALGTISHGVVYWGCEGLKREIEVQKMKAKEEVMSYAGADKYVEQNKNRNEERFSKEKSVETEGQDKKKEWMKKTELETFIAGGMRLMHHTKLILKQKEYGSW